MSTRSYVQELEYGNARGLDTTSPLSMIGEGFVREAHNVNLGATGGYQKRAGYSTQLTTPWTGRSILQGIEYRKADGTVTNVFYGTDKSTTAGVGKESGGAITEFLSGISALVENRMSFVQFQDRLFGFNGDSVNTPFIFEGGSNTRELGIAPPASPAKDPSVSPVNDGSGGLIDGSYLYAYTYVIKDSGTGQVIAESSPSTLAQGTISPPNDAFDVTMYASGVTVYGSLEVLIRLYRTVSGGSILFLEAELIDQDYTTTPYRSVAADDALGLIQLQLDNSQLKTFSGYTKSKYPVVVRNRLFVAHENRNEVRFSKIGQEGPLPESFPAVNFVAVEGKKGSSDQVVGLGQIKGIPIVLKAQSVGRLEEIGLPEITAAEDSVTYLYREISEDIGAVNHFAQTQVFEELLFLSRDNIYATNGQTIRPIAESIQETIINLDFRANKDPEISMANDTKNRRVYISVYSDSTQTEPNLVLVGDYHQYPDFRWTVYSEGTNPSTHPGIRAGCFFQLTNSNDGSLEPYFGNTDANGQYYKMFDGNNDDGDGIYFRLVTRPYAFTQPAITKLYKNTRIFVEAEDVTYELSFAAIFDLNTTEEVDQQSFTLPGIGNNWDENNWADDLETEPDPLIWSGPALKELLYDPHRKAKFMQLVFEQTDANAPVQLLGWSVSGSIFGPI